MPPSPAPADPASGPPSARRLAVVDTRFPWKLSGFRYWESREIFRQRPDTLFFAAEPWSDDFPAPVHPFSQFQTVAHREGITDVYCVFLNLALSLVGCATLPSGAAVPGGNPALSIAPLVDGGKIRVHATLYAGGGLEPGGPAEFLKIAGQKCATIFTGVPEVLESVPRSVFVTGPINTDFYDYAPRIASLPVELAFCHFNTPRKNFPMMAQAFNSLDGSFHLNLIGNWESELHRLTNPNYTFYGILDPERVRQVYRRSHVFVVCSSQDRYSVDGFPTTSGADAMSTGCLLVATNHLRDDRFLRKSVDYLEVPEDDPESLRTRLLWVREHRRESSEIAASGAAAIRRVFDHKHVVEQKLSRILG